MTDEQAAVEIESLDSTDTEVAHCKADELLCNLLRSLGYSKTVEAFESLDKWYA